VEVTLLIEAMDTSFRLMEDARSQAVDLLNTAVKLTSETRDVEEKNIQAIFTGAQEAKSGFQNLVVTFLMHYLLPTLHTICFLPMSELETHG